MGWSQADLLRHLAKQEKTAKPENAVTDESKLHEQIHEECKRRRWLVFHGSMAHRAMRTLGEPDFTIAATDGRVFFIECKSKNGKLTPEQFAIGHALLALGQRYKLVRSLSEFIEFVDAKN